MKYLTTKKERRENLEIVKEITMQGTDKYQVIASLPLLELNHLPNVHKSSDSGGQTKSSKQVKLKWKNNLQENSSRKFCAIRSLFFKQDRKF